MASEKATYSHGHHASVVKSHARRTAENSMAFLLPHLKPSHRVLDVGCGPGTITIGVAKLVSQGTVIGGDSVEDVLEVAKKNAEQQNLSNLSFERIDANALPFDDDSFDVVYCHQVLQHVGDPVAVLKEMRRVTKSGGIVAAREADYRSFAWYPESQGMDAWGDLYQKLHKANGAEPNAGRYLPEWARCAEFAADATTFTWDVWNYQRQEARDFSASWVDRVLHSSFATSAKKHGFAGDDELKVISEAWRAVSESDHPIVIIPNGEILCRV